MTTVNYRFDIQIVMREKILQLIKAHEETTDGAEWSADAITAHVMEFIEWFMWQDEIGCEGCAPNDAGKIMFFDDDGTERDIEGVYQYWLNIKSNEPK